MNEWQEYKLQELVDIISVRVGIENATLENYISTDNMLNDFGGVVKAEKLPTALTVNSFEINDVLFSNIRTYFRKVWISKFNGTVSPDVIVFRAKTNKCNKVFLYYLLCNPEFTEYSVLTSKGAKMPRGDKDALLKFSFKIPTPSEQTAIASILSNLDDKIDLLLRQNATLEKMAETLFRQWFVEEAKEEWEEKNLNEFGYIICGKTPSKRVHSYFGGSIPFIKIPDMHGKTFIFDTEDKLTMEGANSQVKKFLPPMSICVSCIATVGLVSMNVLPSQSNQQINSIIPHKEIYRFFLFLKMKSMKNELLTMASGGTATDNLNTGDFSKICISYPGLIVLEEFHAVVKPLFEKIFANAKQIYTLTLLRDAMLPKLMNGEIKVNL